MILLRFRWLGNQVSRREYLHQCEKPMAGDTVIRRALSQDMEDWARMRKELWPTCSLERHRLEIRHLLDGDGLVALAIVDGDAVGFAELSIRQDHVEGTGSSPVPYLEGWYVAHANRGKGIGILLLTFVEKWSREQGHVEMASDAEIDNHESIRLHMARGFTEVGRTVHFVKKLR